MTLDNIAVIWDFAIGIGRFLLPRDRPRRLKAAQKLGLGGFAGKEPSARRSVTTGDGNLGSRATAIRRDRKERSSHRLRMLNSMFINTLIGKLLPWPGARPSAPWPNRN